MLDHLSDRINYGHLPWLFPFSDDGSANTVILRFIMIDPVRREYNKFFSDAKYNQL